MDIKNKAFETFKIPSIGGVISNTYILTQFGEWVVYDDEYRTNELKRLYGYYVESR